MIFNIEKPEIIESGTGTKENKERRLYFIISYKASDNTDKFLRFEDTRLYKGHKVAKTLKELCNITNADQEPDNINL